MLVHLKYKQNYTFCISNVFLHCSVPPQALAVLLQKTFWGLMIYDVRMQCDGVWSTVD